LFDNIYKKRAVLITGHTGFKGSWLAIRLKELGANVIGYFLALTSKPNIFDANSLREKITHVQWNTLDLDLLMDMHKWNIGTASARVGNVIGGGDWGVDRLARIASEPSS
jgi:hypothetical protein